MHAVLQLSSCKLLQAAPKTAGENRESRNGFNQTHFWWEVPRQRRSSGHSYWLYTLWLEQVIDIWHLIYVMFFSYTVSAWESELWMKFSQIQVIEFILLPSHSLFIQHDQISLKKYSTHAVKLFIKQTIPHQ